MGGWGYKAIIVQKESYLLELARHVVLNPVRARMVPTPDQWPWSSYRATAGLCAASSWLTIDWLLAAFSEHRSEAIRRYIDFDSVDLALSITEAQKILDDPRARSADVPQM